MSTGIVCPRLVRRQIATAANARGASESFEIAGTRGRSVFYAARA